MMTKCNAKFINQYSLLMADDEHPPDVQQRGRKGVRELQ